MGKSQIGNMLKGIERYNPENIKTLEHYVDLQARERGYDLEANLALLKLYQFNPTYYQTNVVVQILMKARQPSSYRLCPVQVSHQPRSLRRSSCEEYLVLGRPAGDVSI